MFEPPGGTRVSTVYVRNINVRTLFSFKRDKTYVVSKLFRSISVYQTKRKQQEIRNSAQARVSCYIRRTKTYTVNSKQCSKIWKRKK